MIDLTKLYEQINGAGLLHKSFFQCTRSEIEFLCAAVMSSPNDEVPPDGWTVPYMENGRLVIPFTAHPKYHWWKPDGQSVMDTLIELNVEWKDVQQHLTSRFSTITEEAYNKKLIPF